MLFKLVQTDDFYEYVSIQLIQTYANSLTLSMGLNQLALQRLSCLCLWRATDDFGLVRAGFRGLGFRGLGVCGFRV